MKTSKSQKTRPRINDRKVLYRALHLWMYADARCELGLYMKYFLFTLTIPDLHVFQILV